MYLGRVVDDPIVNRAVLSNDQEKRAVEEKALVSTLSELAELAERAKRASETTTKLLREYRFIVNWHGMRPRDRIRSRPILDEGMIETWANQS
jgi:hypothetical protein